MSEATEKGNLVKNENEKALSVNIRLMYPDDVAHGMRLSTAEGWNQTEKDWRLFIEDANNICLLAEANEKIVGTTTAIIYANEEAWIGMVLVDKAYRGLGVSKALLGKIFEKLSSCPSIKLDATPAGQPVYQKFGFKDEYLVARMINPSMVNLPQFDHIVHLDPVTLNDLQEIAAFDKIVFGVERRQLLKYMIKNSSGKGWMLKRNDKIEGFVLGRDGSRFHHVGPLVATSVNDAKILLSKAVQSLQRHSVVVDVLSDKKELIDWLNANGFSTQRQFIRMYKENNTFPGQPDKLYLICGPEFG